MHIRRLIAAASVLALTACGDDNGPTTITGLNGALSFTYTGAGGGTFNVSGQMPTIQANLGNNDWAAGHRDTPHSGFGVAGARTRGGGRYDLMGLFIHRLTVGTATIDPNCDSETTNCSVAVLIINHSEADENFDFICFLGTGSLAVTEISDSRIKGTFAGSGSCFNPSFSSESDFTVSGGTFDVPLVTSLPT